MMNKYVCLNGQKLKQLRQDLGLSQEQTSWICKEKGIRLSIATIKRAELGKSLLFRTAFEFSRLFNVRIEDLILEYQNENSSESSADGAKPISVASTKQLAPLSNHSSSRGVVLPAGQPHVSERFQNGTYLNNLGGQDNRLIGRRFEAEMFRRQLEDAKVDGLGRILYVRGIAGIGKTNFLEYIERYTSEHRIPLISVGINQGPDELSFASLLMRAFLSGDESEENKRQLAEVLDDRTKLVLRHLLGEDLFAFRDASELSYTVRSQLEEELIEKALIEFCADCSVLVVDDIHWACERSLWQLRSIANVIRDLPVILVLASRLEGDPIDSVWRSGMLRTPLTTLDLVPLSTSESLELAQSFNIPDQSFIKQVTALAEGNPLFLQQLLSNYPGNVGCFPSNLFEVLREKVADLSKDERKFLQLASAVGINFNLNMLEEILATMNLDPDVQPLINKYLIRPLGIGEFAFCHSLIQQGIYEMLDESDKEAVHLCLAEYFQHHNKPLYAHHLRLSSSYKAPLAALAAAEELVDSYQYAEALYLVEQSLAQEYVDERPSLLVLKGLLLNKMDLPEKSLLWFSKAVDCAETKAEKYSAYVEMALTYAKLDRVNETKKLLSLAETIIPNKEIPKFDIICSKLLGSKDSESTHLIDLTNNDHANSMCQRLLLSPTPLISLAANGASHINNGMRNYSGEIKIGVLHSQTGILAELEEGVIQATLMAVGEINKKGGVLGKQIKPVLFDGRSCESGFIEGANRFVMDPEITTIFGCSSSSTRRSVKPIIEDSDHLLIYPFQYEGIESSENIFYMGPAPNQQALTAVEWLTKHHGRERFYLVGSDYVYPSVINLVIKEQLDEWSVDICGENYVPLGGTDFDKVISGIEATQPDVVVVTVVGLEGNREFFRQLYERNALPKGAIVLSLVLSENDLSQIPIEHVDGIYTSFGYFQNNASILNEQFVRQYKQCFGADKKIGGYMESAYVGVKLWAQAAETAQSLEREKLRNTLRGSSFYGPGGFCYVDENNGHVWRHFYIAQVRSDGEFHTIWQSPHPIRPEPYPLGKSISEWEDTLYQLRRWGSESWEKLAN